MAFRHYLIALGLVFLACSVLAYYPYGPEYRVYGTETYLRAGTYPIYYSNYSPETYTVYSGDYASYTGYYYEPTYTAFSGYAYPNYASYPSYADTTYVGHYWRPYYYRDYPEATAFVTYNTVPTTYSTGYYVYGAYGGYGTMQDYGVYSKYNSYPGFSASYSYTGSGYSGANICTESWCVRLN